MEVGGEDDGVVVKKSTGGDRFLHGICWFESWWLISARLESG